MNIEENIEQNVSLKQFTTFKIGGPAIYFIEADTAEEMIEAIKWAKTNNQKFFLLGGGSNLLISDQGYNGLVIKNTIKSIHREKTDHGYKIICGSGISMARAVISATRNVLTGMEWAIGLPGSVGGAVRGNAGCFGSAMDEVVESVIAYDIDNDKIINLLNKECNFKYRSSIFKQKNYIALEAHLDLKHGHRKKIESRNLEVVTTRVSKQPKYASAGSVFQNVPVSEIDNQELIKEAREDGAIRNDLIAAGWLISKQYSKGKWVGGARVSLDHANFIINKQLKASSDDVLILISLIKQKIRVEYGIQLKEEISYLDY